MLPGMRHRNCRNWENKYVTSCGKGIVAITMLALACAGAGCSLLHGSGHNDGGNVPPSHTVAVERALDDALTNLSLPPGNSRMMNWTPTGRDVLSLLPVHGATYLTGRGYILATADSIGLRCVINVDTLYVSLGSKDDDVRMKRIAEARLTAELKSPKGDRQVFQATGSYKDTIEKRFIGTLDDDHPLLEQSKSIVSYLKPIIYGLTATALVWFLYSYRG